MTPSPEYTINESDILSKMNKLALSQDNIEQVFSINTFIESSLISYKPLGNLVFCRDQQITTSKGVVIGRTISSQRMGEHKIMKQVFSNTCFLLK